MTAHFAWAAAVFFPRQAIVHEAACSQPAVILMYVKCSPRQEEEEVCSFTLQDQAWWSRRVARRATSLFLVLEHLRPLVFFMCHNRSACLLQLSRLWRLRHAHAFSAKHQLFLIWVKGNYRTFPSNQWKPTFDRTPLCGRPHRIPTHSRIEKS